MSRWYKAIVDGYQSPSVEAVDVERVTESSVWIGGRRNSIEGKYCSYFSEFADAKRHVIDYCLGKVRLHESILRNRQKDLRKAECILNPDQGSSSQSE